MQEENPMYVKIDMPTSLRKEVLKTALKSTSLLKDFEQLKEIIQKKKELIARIRSIVIDVKKSEKEFVKLLPELPEEIEKKKAMPKAKKPEAKKEAKKETQIIQMKQEQAGRVKSKKLLDGIGDPIYASLDIIKNRKGGTESCLFLWNRSFNEFIEVGG